MKEIMYHDIFDVTDDDLKLLVCECSDYKFIDVNQTLLDLNMPVGILFDSEFGALVGGSFFDRLTSDYESSEVLSGMNIFQVDLQGTQIYIGHVYGAPQEWEMIWEDNDTSRVAELLTSKYLTNETKEESKD